MASAAFAARRPHSDKKRIRHVASFAVLLIMYVVYVNVANIIMRTFQCESRVSPLSLAQATIASNGRS